MWFGRSSTTDRNLSILERERKKRERSREKSQKIKIINACPTFIPQDLLSIPQTL